MNNQDNKAAQKKIKSPENKFKDTEVCDLNDKIPDCISEKTKQNKHKKNL